MQNLTDYQLPPDPRGPPYHWVVFLIIAMMGLIGILVVTRPPPESTYEPRTELVSPEATFPREIVAAAIADMTFIAPTHTPPPEPKSTSLPTTPLAADIHLICGEGVPLGSSCTWGASTQTPTPPPSPCETPTPGQECVWTGGIARSTPTYTTPTQRPINTRTWIVQSGEESR